LLCFFLMYFFITNVCIVWNERFINIFAVLSSLLSSLLYILSTTNFFFCFFLRGLGNTSSVLIKIVQKNLHAHRSRNRKVRKTNHYPTSRRRIHWFFFFSILKFFKYILQVVCWFLNLLLLLLFCFVLFCFVFDRVN
jgi:hypothetical protein